MRWSTAATRYDRHAAASEPNTVNALPPTYPLKTRLDPAHGMPQAPYAFLNYSKSLLPALQSCCHMGRVHG